jgi:MFS family permease
MQTVLSPLVGRLSDVLDRKLFASIPPLIAVAGSIICAKATSMQMLIGGGILVGFTLATISIVQSIPSEILPLKYRALANGFAFLGGAVGGLVGGLGAGAVTNVNPAGWRNIFWIMAALHGATSLGFLTFYWPKKRTEYPRMSFKECVWACDPIGSILFIAGATLMLLALNWAGGAYHWSDAHVCATLVVGFVLVLAFCIYGKLVLDVSKVLKLTVAYRMEGKI